MEKIQMLRMRGITRRFGASTALDNFNLDIAGGTFTTLLGPSGCGKSTALNCLAGLLDLSEGEILLNGRQMQHIPAEKRGFGMVFQNYALFPHLTVMRNVTYGMEIRGVAKGERERRALRALEQVHLAEYGKRYPAQLSGGQQQRLAIARTIVLEPALLLLDEPLSNLDANLRNEMRIEIKRLHNQLGLTTIYVTHDQSEAMSLSDTVVVMRSGRIEQIGKPQDIYLRPRSLFIAGFMGYSNRIPVKLLAHEGDNWLVQTVHDVQLHATVTSEQSAQWNVGDQAIACAKPDETLVGPLSIGGNRLRGRVQLVEYMGKSFELLVRLDDANDIQLLVQSPQPVDAGTEIEFGVRPDKLLLFAAKEPASQHDAVMQAPTAVQVER